MARSGFGPLLQSERILLNVDSTLFCFMSGEITDVCLICTSRQTFIFSQLMLKRVKVKESHTRMSVWSAADPDL